MDSYLYKEKESNDPCTNILKKDGIYKDKQSEAR